MFSDGGIDRRPAPETEETNYIEPEPEAVRDRELQPRSPSPKPSPNDNAERNQVVSKEEMCKYCPQYSDVWFTLWLLLNCFKKLLVFLGQMVDCDTKLRDRCKGTTCNR